MSATAELDTVVKTHLYHLLSKRTYPKTICPSEVARSLSTNELDILGVSNWRDLMPMVRIVLWEMRDRGEVEILQRGSPIPSTIGVQDVQGPIRARKPL